MIATLEEYTARHGSLPTEDESIIEALLVDASDLIVDVAGDSDAEWVTDEDNPDPPRRIVAICVAVAHRAFVNPTALSQKALGQSSYVYRGDEPDALYLTDREIRAVRGAASLTGPRSVTLVSPYSGDDEVSNDLPL